MNIELTEAQKVKVFSPRDLYPVMREILLRESEIDLSKEHFWVCGLAANNKLMYLELVSLGTVTQMVVEPVAVFRWAVQKNVFRIILVHNHPSEDLLPSEADKDLTNQLIQVGKIVQVEVTDHMIITPDGFYSFDKKGLMAKLERSTKYVPDCILRKQIKKKIEKAQEEYLEIGKAIGHEEGLEEGEKIGIEKGRKEGEEIGLKRGEDIGIKKGKELGKQEGIMEVALRMKQNGAAVDTICDVTGLSPEEVESL